MSSFGSGQRQWVYAPEAILAYVEDSVWERDEGGARFAVLHLEIYVSTATYLSVVFSELLLLACNHAIPKFQTRMPSAPLIHCL